MHVQVIVNVMELEPVKFVQEMNVWNVINGIFAVIMLVRKYVKEVLVLDY